MLAATGKAEPVQLQSPKQIGGHASHKRWCLQCKFLVSVVDLIIAFRTDNVTWIIYLSGCSKSTGACMHMRPNHRQLILESFISISPFRKSFLVSAA